MLCYTSRHQDNLQELVLSFHHRGPRDQTQVAKCVINFICHLTDPPKILDCFLCFCEEECWYFHENYIEFVG